MSSQYLVDIQEERLSFFTPAGEVKALNNVTLQMREGEVLGIVGESGSGKSVTAYSIMGLTAQNGKIVGGSVEFNGHKIHEMSEKELRKIRGNEVSIIFQDPMTSLNPVWTVGNQIAEAVSLHTDKKGRAAMARAKELLELVGINEPEKRLKQYPHELSGGMRQRVMIAIALACEPKLLIADEPTTALDVTIQAQILELMQELKRKLGMGIIMITHDLGVVASMCEGQPVDLLNPPKGCGFAPRCSNCMKLCLSHKPEKNQYEGVHYARCFMQQKEDFLKERGET